MKIKLMTLIMCLFFGSAWAGDLTNNGYFYLPAKGSYGTAERNYWFTVLNQTDNVLKGVLAAIAELQANGGSGGSSSSDEWDNDGTNIFNNTSFGNVGIGTTNPDVALDVAGIINADLGIKVNGIDVCLSNGTNCALAISFDPTDYGTIAWGAGSSFVWTMNAGATDPAFSFASGSTTLDNSSLTVNGATSQLTFGGNNMFINGDTPRKIKIGSTGGTNNEDIRIDNDSTANTIALDSTTGVTTLSAPDFTFVTGGLKSATSLNIGASYYSAKTPPTNGAIIQGNVGIGTWLPSTNFQVVGNARITGLTANECVQTSTGGLLTTTGAACGSGGGGVGVGTVNPGVVGSIPYYLASTTVDDSPVLFTDGSNVGVGTTGPTSKLQVSGTVTATAFSGDGSALTGLPSASGWTDGGTNVYTTTTTDKVGIGTTTPTTTVEIVKQSSSAPLMVSSTATGDGDYLIVASTGNVGVGTINPETTLNVRSATSSGFKVTNSFSSSSTQGGTVQLVSDDGAALVQGDRMGGIIAGGSADTADTVVSGAAVTMFADGTLSASSAPSEVRIETSPSGSTTRVARVYVKSDGTVGIGTANPQSVLQVSGDTKIGNGTFNNASANEDLYVEGNLEVDGTLMGDGSGLINLASTSGGWSDGGTNVYTSTTTDTVGIGTTTASGTLEIVKQGSAIPLMVSATATGDGDYFVINSAGNIGIGTTTSLNQKLTVNGGIASLGSSAGSIVLNEAIANGSNTITISAPSSLTNDRNCTLEDDSTPFDSCISAPSAGGGWTDGGTSIYNTTTTDNVGIGTSLPAALLEVKGSGNNLFNLSSGNVGIGTAVPLNTLTVNGTFATHNANSIGWSVVAASNQACNTTCVSACVFGMDNDSTTNSLLGCTDAAADRCLCAGAN